MKNTHANNLNKYNDFDPNQIMLNNKIPLVSNGISIHIVNEHQGEIFFSKWNPFKRLLATGGASDYFVNLWDYN